ncbi:MAG TPA: hypothetical protein EYQ73_02060 [Candidatus Poseidoniales archaeon]|nr:hypothetical protein [Candidatus Poseidoniales archaeon]HIL65654.1 hypothetical protein [Candidatus Poseidoniales archaeon]
MGRNRGLKKRQRREKALDAQQILSSVIANVSMPMVARQNAAQHLVKTSSRHRLPLPQNLSHWICRSCTQLLIPSVSARVRIRAGQRIITCLNCNRVRRFGIKGGSY